MKNNKIRNRISIILFSILVFLAIAIIAVNIIIGNIIEKKINKAFSDKYENRYDVSIKDVSVNIISGNVTLKDVKIKPDTAFLSFYKTGNSAMSFVMDIEVPRFKLVGLSVLEAVTKKTIDIGKLEIVDAKIMYYTGYKPADTLPEVNDTVQKKLDLDSIQIKGIEGVFVGKIELVNAGIQLHNVKTDTREIAADNIDVAIEGVSLNKLEGEDDYFKLVLDDLKISLVDEKLSLPGDWYFLTFGKLIYDKATTSLFIQDLKLFPQYDDLYKMAQKLVYTTEIFNVGVGEINVYNFNLRQIVNEDKFYADSIVVSSLDLDILKDKRLPWNYDKRPMLPNQNLRLMDYPLYIGEVHIRDSKFKYHEKMEDSDEQMSVTLSELNVDAKFLTSVKDSTSTGKPMTIHLVSKLMDAANLQGDFYLRLNSPVDAFTFTGSLGRAKLATFNGALKPAAGIKVETGDLKIINFHASANNTLSTGKMTMIYSDLTAEVLKKNVDDKGKFLSFLANTVLLSSNPNKNGKLRIAQMGFERVMYKGFGNFIWKTLQTGLVNTVLPTGKSEKQVKEVAKTSEKQSKKEQRENKKKK